MSKARMEATISPTAFSSPARSGHRDRKPHSPADARHATSGRGAASLPSGPTPMPVRVARVARVSAHVAEGLLTTFLVFPFVAAPRRTALIRGWSVRLLRILAVELRVHWHHDGGLPGKSLIVANHISWIDIFLLSALQPARFIAKAELARWPVVGRLITSVGTLFIERERRHDTHKVNRRAADALANGDVVAVFPEGTTSDGTDLLRFHASLLQPIVDAEGHVQPIAIRYRTPAGRHTSAPAYAGDTTFWGSFRSVLRERRLVAELHIAPPVEARERHRRELSRAAEEAIRKALGLAVADSAPGRRADPRA